jgi:hypothetical protein
MIFFCFGAKNIKSKDIYELLKKGPVFHSSVQSMGKINHMSFLIKQYHTNVAPMLALNTAFIIVVVITTATAAAATTTTITTMD